MRLAWASGRLVDPGIILRIPPLCDRDADLTSKAHQQMKAVSHLKRFWRSLACAQSIGSRSVSADNLGAGMLLEPLRQGSGFPIFQEIYRMTFSDRSKLRGIYPNPASPETREQPDVTRKARRPLATQGSHSRSPSILTGCGAGSGVCTRSRITTRKRLPQTASSTSCGVLSGVSAVVCA